jgi:hypothetical protein
VPTRPLDHHSNGIQLVQLLPTPTGKVESPMEFQMTNVYLFIVETNGIAIPVGLPLLQCVNCFLIASKKEQFGVDDNQTYFTIPPKYNYFKFKYAILQKMEVIKYYTILMVLALAQEKIFLPVFTL